jgi:hypothetical protein
MLLRRVDDLPELLSLLSLELYVAHACEMAEESYRNAIDTCDEVERDLVA